MPKVVSIVQRKGGVSKSTLAVSLAAVAASENVSAQKRSGTSETFPRGNGPILVDTDAQGSASTWALGGQSGDTIARAQSVAMLAFPPALEWLSPSSPLRDLKTPEELLESVLPDCLLDTVVPGLRLIGSTPSVHPENLRDIVLRGLPADLVVVDTPPDTSLPIVRSVLAQSDAVLIPVVPEPWSVDMIAAVFNEIRSVGRRDLLDDRRVRVVVSRRERNKVHDVLEASLRETLGSIVSDTVVPKSAAIGLVSHRAENLTAKHPLRKIAAALLREILAAADMKGLAA